MISAFTLEGKFRLESFADEPVWEYRTAAGGSMLVPFTMAPYATDLYKGRGKPLQFVRLIGQKLDEAWWPNLILNEGLEAVAKYLANEASLTGITKMEIGDGNGAAVTPDEDDSAIAAPTNRARVSVNTPVRSGAEVTISAPFTAGQSNYVVREVALFANTASSTFGVGDMVDYSSTSFDNTSPNTALVLSGVLSVQRKGEV